MTNKVQEHFDDRSSRYELTDWVTGSALENKIIKIIRAAKPKTLLDLGIGTGVIEQKIPGGIGISGIDISEGMLEICQSRLPSAHLVCGNLTDLDKYFRKNSFDAIFARAALGHLKISPILKKAKQLLSSRGIIILCESIAYDRADCGLQVEFHNLIHPGHVEFPTGEQFVKKFSDLGMTTKYEIIFTESSTESLFNSTNPSKERRFQIEAFLLKLSERESDPWIIRKSGSNIIYRRPWLLSISQK